MRLIIRAREPILILWCVFLFVVRHVEQMTDLTGLLRYVGRPLVVSCGAIRTFPLRHGCGAICEPCSVSEACDATIVRYFVELLCI